MTPRALLIAAILWLLTMACLIPIIVAITDHYSLRLT